MDHFSNDRNTTSPLWRSCPQVWTRLWIARCWRDIPSVVATSDLWIPVAASLRQQVSDAVWQSTFSSVDAVSADGTLVLKVPSTLVRERIEGKYLAIVRDAVDEAGGSSLQLLIEVATDDRTVPNNLLDAPSFDDLDPQLSSLEHEQVTVDNTGGSPADGPARPGRADARVDKRYTFDAFVTGTSNRFAHAAALRVAEQPGQHYNPLFIYGDAGLGKTHLLQAIAHYVTDVYPSMKIRYVSTETFLNEFVDSIRTGTPAEFKRRYREMDVLLVDDIQFMEGKDGLQEEFFHTFNQLHEAGHQIVLSSDRPPDSISTLEDRLRSRFKMGLITDIQPPDLETRMAILRKKGERLATPIPNDVLEFIATHVIDNIRELEGALTRITAWSTLNNEPLSVPMTERVLADILADQQPQPITVSRIIDETADIFGFTQEEICGKSRRRPLVTARQIAMYVSRELTDLSYPAIAREFGGRDHTTVMHAVDKIASQMGERSQIYDQVLELRKRTRGGR
ncbi:MAG: chromosomal replication initiator protein DnaA [Actinomycetia bacterium]|nr:chromosomal replication initiator protein DnaA [Actinomycetes bacterium]